MILQSGIFVFQSEWSEKWEEKEREMDCDRGSKGNRIEPELGRVVLPS